MIRQSAISTIINRRTNNGPLPFSVKYRKKSTGEEILLENVICTSSYHEGWFRVKILSSKQFRTIREELITEINGTEVIMA
jgi:hypothetical protein